MTDNKLVINIPMFCTKITVLFGTVNKDFKIPKGVQASHLEGDYQGRSILLEGGSPFFHVVIHIKDINKSGVIIHEIYHAVNYIQGAIGIVPDFNNDEFGAYLMQHISEEVFIHISKLRNKQ